jgi:hypothetical protein
MKIKLSSRNSKLGYKNEKGKKKKYKETHPPMKKNARKNKIGLEKKKKSKQNSPLYNQYNDNKHIIFEQTNKRWKFIDHKGNEMDNMLDKSMCMRDQTVAGYNNRTNRSLQTGEDVCCWGITRERRVSNYPLCSFPSILKEQLNPPSNAIAFEVYCSICPHEGATEV